MAAYYNEIDAYAAQWLRNLIAAGHIAPGDVDERSIVDVNPDDLKGYTQCHFFAGIGGWSYAARLAGYPDDRELWTGSCPCQPFSVAGKGEGQADERHLWPVFFELISSRRPNVVMGEQVAAAVGKDWLDGVHSDLESIGYACGASVVPACAVDAPHRRDRLWFVADRDGGQPGSIGRNSSKVLSLSQEQCEPEFSPALSVRGGQARDDDVDNSFQSRLEGQPRHGDDSDQSRRDNALSSGPVATGGGALSNTDSVFGGQGCEINDRGDQGSGPQPWPGLGRNSGHWRSAEWAVGADGKARRIEPSIRLLAHGVPGRVGKLRAYGNAIVPQVAAEVIGAYMEIAA